MKQVLKIFLGAIVLEIPWFFINHGFPLWISAYLSFLLGWGAAVLSCIINNWLDWWWLKRRFYKDIKKEIQKLKEQRKSNDN